MDPRGDPYLELLAQTSDDEVLLACTIPPDDGDYERWYEDFESGKLATTPFYFHTYFGPTDAPRTVERTIFVGEGLVSSPASGLIVTLAPNVFRDAAASLLSSSGLAHADVELRIFHIFTIIDPDSFSRFLSTLETLQAPQAFDSSRLISRDRKPTYEKPRLNAKEMISVLSKEDGVISYQQLYEHIPLQDRTLRRYLERAEMVETGQKRLTGCLFTSDEVLNTLVPWLRKNVATHGVREFIMNLLIANLIPH